MEVTGINIRSKCWYDKSLEAVRTACPRRKYFGWLLDQYGKIRAEDCPVNRCSLKTYDAICYFKMYAGANWSIICVVYKMNLYMTKL